MSQPTDKQVAIGKALGTTARRNNVKRLQVLLAEGADVEMVDADGWTPLHWEGMKNASAPMKTLIEVGADFEAADPSGRRPLHWAAINDAVAAIKTLIEAEADINATDSNGDTPLHKAAEDDCLDALQILLGAGADAHLLNRDGKTPLSLARENRHCAVVKALEEATGRRSTSRSTQESFEEQEENAPDAALSDRPIPALQPPIEEQPVSDTMPKETPQSEHQQFGSKEKVQSREPSRNTDEISQTFSQISKENDDSSYFDSDSSWVSEEVTDEVRAVQDLKEDVIFAENYILEGKRIAGKPLVRLAKGVLNNIDVVLKFYDKPLVYAKALSSFKSLNKSNYICKPIDEIKARQGLPNCLVFEKGIHTFDEWMRIDHVCSTSKREALQLVAFALDDLHSRNVVHCDIKPANLAFFPTEHKWKLLDIDSAMEAGAAGEICMTISYASPEVLEAVEEGKTELAVHPSVDMWAYGIIAFELFTGERFYEFEPSVKSVLEFLKSKRFKSRVHQVKDRKQRHFVNKFLKRNASERRSAQEACMSSTFQEASVTISKPLVSRRSSI